MNIDASIVIKAKPDRVWAILSDFAQYAAWNPFIVRASGAATQGSRISVVIRPPGQKGMSFRPKLLLVEPDHCLIWRGSVGLRGVFDGTHMFKIEPLDDMCVRFSQSETFTGFLRPFVLSKAFEEAAVQGFQQMNEALKRRAEGGEINWPD